MGKVGRGYQEQSSDGFTSHLTWPTFQSFSAFCHTALYSIYPVQVALNTKSLVCSYTNKFKYGSVAALARMLCNKGISGVPCGFEEW